jgi:hypothetical protein
MRSDDPSAEPRLPAAGLCSRCEFQRVITSGRGSRFSLCERSATDPAYPKYPRLPVLACAGFVRREPEPEPSDAAIG